MNYEYLLQELQIDCASCSGLCCYGLYLCKGESFAFEKQAGIPCPHLQPDFRCDCYQCLHQLHMKGCTIYDCFGAGQYVTQVIYRQKTWQDLPSLKDQICDIFSKILQLHQILYYLITATSLPQAHPYLKELETMINAALQLRTINADQLLRQNISLFQSEANQVLKKICKDVTPYSRMENIYLLVFKRISNARI